MRCKIVDLIYFPDFERRFLGIQLQNEFAYLGGSLLDFLSEEKTCVFDCHRINFVCKETSEEVSTRLEDCMGIVQMDILFNPAYFEWIKDEKILYLKALLRESLCTLCSRKGWNWAPVKCALDKLDGDVVERTYFAKITRRHESMTAKIRCVQNFEAVNLYMVIRERRTIISAQWIATGKPNVFDHFQLLGRIDWIPDKGFCLLDIKGNIVGSVMPRKGTNV